MTLADAVERIEQADIRRNERWCAADVPQPLAKFTQGGAVFDFDEDGAERGDHRASDGRFGHLQWQEAAFPDVRCRNIEHGGAVRYAAHRQVRAKRYGLMLRGQALNEILELLL